MSEANEKKKCPVCGKSTTEHAIFWRRCPKHGVLTTVSVRRHLELLELEDARIAKIKFETHPNVLKRISETIFKCPECWHDVQLLNCVTVKCLSCGIIKGYRPQDLLDFCGAGYTCSECGIMLMRDQNGLTAIIHVDIERTRACKMCEPEGLEELLYNYEQGLIVQNIPRHLRPKARRHMNVSRRRPQRGRRRVA